MLFLKIVCFILYAIWLVPMFLILQDDYKENDEKYLMIDCIITFMIVWAMVICVLM